MNSLAHAQAELNATSRDRWAAFAPHRARVTALLGRPGGRLCVLGAGNGNDLDLAALLDVHREIHLVDLDGAALADGVARQGVGGHAGVHCHGGLDVTGVFDAMAAWSPRTVLRDADLAACADGPARGVAAALPGPFDVVVSACVLSQLIAAVARALGYRHPQFVAAMRAVRAGHLRLLARLLAPGGAGVLVTDVVSSLTLPALATAADADLPALLAEQIRARNFFHGVNPAVLADLFLTDPVLAALVTDVESVPPWRWDMGPRLYAVCAVKVRGRPGPAL